MIPPSTLKRRPRRIDIILSSGIFVPRKWLILSGSNFTVASVFSLTRASIIPSTTSPAPSISASSHALSMATRVISLSSPFSKRPELSVLIPSAREVIRTELPIKFADSKTTTDVVSLISLLAPPITPARATGFFSSAITSIPAFRV